MKPLLKDVIKDAILRSKYHSFSRIPIANGHSFYVFNSSFLLDNGTAIEIYKNFHALGVHCILSTTKSGVYVTVHGSSDFENPKSYLDWAELAAEMEVAR